MKLSALWPFGRKSANNPVNSHELFALLFGGRTSKAGPTVTLESAMRVSVVLACARVIAEGIAQVPFKLFRDEGRNKLPAREHPTYKVLHRRPNSWMTSFELRELMGYHCALARQFIAFVSRDMKGRVIEIIPFVPGSVKVEQGADWALTYTVTAKNGSTQRFPQDAIWHVRGPSWDGVVGMDILNLAREAIGLAIAAEESQSALHKGGLRWSGLYSVEDKLNGEQYKQLKGWIDENYAGEAAESAIMLLDRAAKFTPMSMSGVEAQSIETRRFQIEEVCRAMRVMPIMVGYSDKAATYASAEQMFLAHVVHTLAPWYERIEQSADVQLLTDPDQDQGLYFKFVTAGLLRGALKDTAEFLNKLVSTGILTRNEARELLERNPRDGLDEPLTPMNMIAGAPDDEQP